MLTQSVESYIAVRRATGFAFRSEGSLLQSFAAFSDAAGKRYVNAEAAIEWAGSAPSLCQRARRLGQVIRFARYIRAEDAHHEIPPTVFGSESRPRPVPYIFSAEEIKRILQTASGLGKRNAFRGHTYNTLFALLACTGLRVSEAIHLCFQDITADGLVIRCSKFRKSRLVPLHETTLAGLEQYLLRRRVYTPLDDHVFVSLRRRPLLLHDAETAFHDIVEKIGIPRGAGLPRPTIHSLRHTFAVRALETCPDGRDRITKHMLALSTYLGHSKVADTYWYLARGNAGSDERHRGFVPKLLRWRPAMIFLAPHIAAFLQQRLPIERRASPNTCDSYAHAFRLLFEYASVCLKLPPSQLQLEQLDAPLIVNFLNHLETSRGNGAGSRNIRLAAIKSFMHYLEYRVPSALEQIQRILAIPAKKTDTRLVRHLTVQEIQSILDAPDPTVRDGIRDRAMLHLCFAAGLRVSELVGLQIEDMMLQPQASVLIHGKGRKERCLPLWKETASAVRAWLSVRGEVRVPELFLNARNDAMTRAGFEYILHKHAHTAETRCSTLSSKRVSPHVLRHTCALTILQATKDLRKVSLWLGHSSMQTTEIYTRADPSVKLDALESVIAPKLRTGRFKATDKLIEMLKAAPNMRSKKTAK